MAIISFILVFLLIVLLMLLLCTITIRIEELDLSNCNYKSKLEYDFEIYFELYVLNKLKIHHFGIEFRNQLNHRFNDKLKNLLYNGHQ